jgi:hypothetical protein
MFAAICRARPCLAAWLRIAGPAPPRNTHTRVPVRCDRARQSRRPIPREAAGVGVVI